MRKIAVIGLGYVGLPIAVAFGALTEVIGFDVSERRINALKALEDITREMTAEDLANAQVNYTCDPKALKAADFFIVTVPTPINNANHPDFSALISASTLIGQNLKPNDIVVYESTVYPGATEEICIPVLEQHAKLKAGRDFFVGYSPERINPSDKEHVLVNTIKIISGQTPATLDIIAETYEQIVKAGVYRASSIKVAEAAKVIENAQRDINIAFVNELALICHRLGIDTQEVLDAAGTKWNFLKFKPGLVGGHCISVDPYYLAYKAMTVGYLPEIILAGRRVNDDMGFYVARQIIKHISQDGKCTRDLKVGVLGITFKENCPDIRNSKVFDIITELREFGIHNIKVFDPIANRDEVQHEFYLELSAWEDLENLDVLIMAVRHKEFLQLDPALLSSRMKAAGLLIDIKSALDKAELEAQGIKVWRL